MSEYYYGTIGKHDGWHLLANKPIVVWSNGVFSAFDSIAEADKAYVDTVGQKVYFCQQGKWNEVNFLVEGTSSKPAIGFLASPEAK
jgi:hypothetical protein